MNKITSSGNNAYLDRILTNIIESPQVPEANSVQDRTAQSFFNLIATAAQRSGTPSIQANSPPTEEELLRGLALLFLNSSSPPPPSPLDRQGSRTPPPGTC